jgi:hypothetical protein
MTPRPHATRPATPRDARTTARRDRVLTEIAARHLGIATLEERRSDRLDCHDCSVVAIREALEAAYAAGAASAAAAKAVRA